MDSKNQKPDKKAPDKEGGRYRFKEIQRSEYRAQKHQIQREVGIDLNRFKERIPRKKAPDKEGGGDRLKSS